MAQPPDPPPAPGGAAAVADAEADPPTPVAIVARLAVRQAYRQAAGQAKQRAVLLLGGYRPKFQALDRHFGVHGKQAVMVDPRVAPNADVLVDFLDAHGISVEYAVPLIDAAVCIADILNTRLRGLANDPATSSLRRDKYEQQEALRRAGLPAAAQRFATSAEEAVRFLAEAVEGRGSDVGGCSEEEGAPKRVVVKPRDSSGGDGICLCRSEAEIRASFERELGRVNMEGGTNKDLIVMEALEGEEWVVNTVSLLGVHKVTDAWRGPPKVVLEWEGGAQFVYTAQFLAEEHPRRAAVLEYTFACLDALGVRNGAAHTELIWTVLGPRLLEVNARPAGGLPRTPRSPNQLEALAMSLYDADHFLSLPTAPVGAAADDGHGEGQSAAVVFLRAPFNGYILGTALQQIVSLRTFGRFERDAIGLARFAEVAQGAGPPPPPSPVAALAVVRTTSLFTTPGAVVLLGAAATVEEDAQAIRAIEAIAYSETYPAEDVVFN